MKSMTHGRTFETPSNPRPCYSILHTTPHCSHQIIASVDCWLCSYCVDTMYHVNIMQYIPSWCEIFKRIFIKTLNTKCPHLQCFNAWQFHIPIFWLTAWLLSTAHGASFLILSHKKKIHENHTMYFMYAFRCSVILSCSKMFLGDLGSIA